MNGQPDSDNPTRSQAIRSMVLAHGTNAVLEVVAGSVLAAIEKWDDAPESALSHMREAADLLGQFHTQGNIYSDSAKALRAELWRLTT